MNTPTPCLSRDERGFSLVEVVIAIGLLTFVLLVIFSLMPAGMASLQEANRQIVETEIFNIFGAELSATPFAKIDDYVSSRFPAYFGNNGNEVAAGEAVFTVRCTANLPELGTGELRRTSVLIGHQVDPAQTTNTQKVSKRTFLLVDRGL